jgi:hypothetical protein
MLMMMRRPEFLMMRRPEFLMMPTPRRPAPPQKSGPIGLYITTNVVKNRWLPSLRSAAIIYYIITLGSACEKFDV